MQRKSCYKAIIQSMSPDNIINHESEHQVSVRLARLCNWFTTSRDAYQPMHCYQGHIKHEHTLLNINIFKDSDVLKHRLLLANGFCSPWQNKSKAFDFDLFSFFIIIALLYWITPISFHPANQYFCRITTGYSSVFQVFSVLILIQITCTESLLICLSYQCVPHIYFGKKKS